MVIRPFLLLGVALLATWAVACPSLGQDATNAELNSWHRWRGPLATGVAPNGNPPTTWDSESNIKWKRAIPGRGSGSPIIWGDKLFVSTAVETDKQPAGEDKTAPIEVEEEEPQNDRRRRRRGPEKPTNLYTFDVLCLDRNTGDEIWSRTVTEAVPIEAGHSTNTFASASPVTDGERLYVSFGSYGVFCLTMDGKPVWDRDFGDMQTRAAFGEGASPALYEDTLVVNWDHEGQSFIVAVDAKNGETRWKKDRDERTTWVTPLIVEAAGRTQVIVNGSNKTRSYDLANGDVIWECGGQVGNPIPTAIVLDDLVYCMSGYRGAAIYAIRLDSQGDISGSDSVAWHATRGAPYVPSPLLYGERLYFTKSNNGILSILNARTGEALVNQHRLPGVDSIYASPVAAAGKVYIVSRDGVTVVLKDADEIDILATNELGEGIDASPAIVGNHLFLRGEKHLFCIEQH